jgi:hypothetical protein
MVFCGKCGFQLTSGNIICPRCGTPTDTELISDESQPDSPTIAASTIFGMTQSYAGSQETISPGRPMEQQPLILGPHPNDYGSAEQMANETTNMIHSQNTATGQEPTRAVYPEYASQNAANYPQQRAPYPGYAMPGGTTTSYQQQLGASSEEAEKVRARGRITGLLLILIGLLFILGAMVLFILTHTTSTSAPSSIQQTHVAFAFLFPLTL